ncbi:MAG: adenosylhomocysteinase, partial [Actinomycetota bacterium]|nr:adenosylhomocysteinase [Actinomycetota bacterium]
MPVLRSIRERFDRDKPLEGVKVAACLHVTAETAGLMRTLVAGGAEAALCSANPLTTQDAVAAALVEAGVPVQARRGEDVASYVRHVHALADWMPDITLDDGADLLMLIHERDQQVEGGAEETRSGLLRLRRLE